MSDPTDVYVGARVREARLAAGLSQTTLAGMLGVAYQQIQKYENASNRISCSRIVRIAAALGRPVEWFFDEAPLGPTQSANPVAPSQGTPARGRYDVTDERSSLVVRNPSADASPARSNTGTRTFTISS